MDTVLLNLFNELTYNLNPAFVVEKICDRSKF